MKISLPLIRPVLTGACLLLIILLGSGAATASVPAGLVSALVGQSGAANGVALNPSHPDRYVVKRGDTLWDISALFLKDPWYWPEIWRVNPQVENPHLIYPGDVLVLVYIDGKPQLRLERAGGDERLSPQIRSQDLDGALGAAEQAVAGHPDRCLRTIVLANAGARAVSEDQLTVLLVVASSTHRTAAIVEKLERFERIDAIGGAILADRRGRYADLRLVWLVWLLDLNSTSAGP